MSSKTGCCAPARDTGARGACAGEPDRWMAAALAVPAAPEPVRLRLHAELTRLPGGAFEMGTPRSTFPGDGDSPRHRVDVAPFRISCHAVTNAAFSEFIAATGYRTVAEREGWSFVFHLFLGDLARWPDYPPSLPWWRRVDGASWAAPEGPGSDWRRRADHPAVHLSWYDARAYCQWAGLRLPREVEWEYAARGGLERQKFPWGDALTPGGRFMMNTWQGDFPVHNSAADGFAGTAPVDSFKPNGFGLSNMTGNVWEWVEDRFGPSGGRVQRGGSYLCHVSYCDRYHVHSRTGNDPDSSTGHAGFRVAADA